MGHSPHRRWGRRAWGAPKRQACRPEVRPPRRPPRPRRTRSNFREKFQALNHVRLTDAEFARLVDGIVSADVFTASRTLRTINSFTRDYVRPPNYTLVNIKDWCKNTFEVVNQIKSNTDNSYHRFDYKNDSVEICPA
jgi:hypothetical protein